MSISLAFSSSQSRKSIYCLTQNTTFQESTIDQDISIHLPLVPTPFGHGPQWARSRQARASLIIGDHMSNATRVDTIKQKKKWDKAAKSWRTRYRTISGVIATFSFNRHVKFCIQHWNSQSTRNNLH
jgi:hypothetical protein